MKIEEIERMRRAYRDWELAEQAVLYVSEIRGSRVDPLKKFQAIVKLVEDNFIGAQLLRSLVDAWLDRVLEATIAERDKRVDWAKVIGVDPTPRLPGDETAKQEERVT